MISWSSFENRQLDGAAHPGASRIALGRITALGVWQKQTSTDRRLFEANRGLTYQEAASSIDYQRRNSRGSLKRKKELDERGPHRSKRRTPRCGVRYTRKKLPLTLLRGLAECDSWDISPFKIPAQSRHFGRSTFSS